MGPAGLFKMLPVHSKNAKTATSIPILAEDGSNWEEYAAKLCAAAKQKKLVDYLDSRAQKPPKPTHQPDRSMLLPDRTILTDEDEIYEVKKRYNEYIQ